MDILASLELRSTVYSVHSQHVALGLGFIQDFGLGGGGGGGVELHLFFFKYPSEF